MAKPIDRKRPDSQGKGKIVQNLVSDISKSFAAIQDVKLQFLKKGIPILY